MSVPFGPWGFDSSGAPQRTYFNQGTFFSFGPSPSTGTIANTIDGATNIPFMTCIFDDSPNTWADCQLGTANLVASMYGNQGMFYANGSPGLNL